MKQRITTGIIAGGAFLLLCLLGGLWYHSLLLVMALIGYYEFVRMTKLSPFGAVAMIGYVGVLMFIFPWKLLHVPLPFPLEHGLWVFMLLFLVFTVTSKNVFNIKHAALMFIGMVYIGVGFSYIAESRNTDDGHGLFWTFLLLASIWASDAGAYFTGKFIGKHKLWPAISPNKTVEGAAGGVIIAVIVAVIFSVISPDLLSFGRACAIGFIAAVVGQMGDLVQSAYKRVYDIKDSGNILPGHGGILDRCDSWLTVFPLIHILMLLPY
ncbi:phosphatidate cytidylyltransferase [Paenibacillus sediminis]|uniref:Phosphatidate cytidylyltransferase n=1 Tax=Paenibacillus sediminis TaxID=664909 RepID=A0ABS4H1J2_9BACL|nr:phosphatidate cytidylyltransferase [Paenibacillus sediminis]